MNPLPTFIQSFDYLLPHCYYYYCPFMPDSWLKDTTNLQDTPNSPIIKHMNDELSSTDLSLHQLLKHLWTLAVSPVTTFAYYCYLQAATCTSHPNEHHYTSNSFTDLAYQSCLSIFYIYSKMFI